MDRTIKDSVFSFSFNQCVRPILYFILSFSIPLLILLFWLSDEQFSFFNNEQTIEADKNFPNALVVKSRSDNLVIKAADDLQPMGGRDFSLIIWLRLLRLPAEQPRAILAVKYESDTPTRPGYALALSRDGNKVRPLVYWSDSHKLGKWYNFESYEFDPKKWQALVLSFVDGEYIGLHLVEPGAGESGIKLLGGYRFERPTFAISSADLKVGGLEVGQLPRMRVGAFAIAQTVNLEEKLLELLNGIAAHKDAKSVVTSGMVDPVFFIDNFREIESALSPRILSFPAGRKERGR